MKKGGQASEFVYIQNIPHLRMVINFGEVRPLRRAGILQFTRMKQFGVKGENIPRSGSTSPDILCLTLDTYYEKMKP